MKTISTLDEFLEGLPALAEERRDTLRGHSGLFLFEIKQGRRVFIRLANGSVFIEENAADAPLCTVCADEKVLLEMIAGKLSPMKALLLRKVSLKGNAAALLDLVRLLS